MAEDRQGNDTCAFTAVSERPLQPFTIITRLLWSVQDVILHKANWLCGHLRCLSPPQDNELQYESTSGNGKLQPVKKAGRRLLMLWMLWMLIYLRWCHVVLCLENANISLVYIYFQGIHSSKMDAHLFTTKHIWSLWGKGVSHTSSKSVLWIKKQV